MQTKNIILTGILIFLCSAFAYSQPRTGWEIFMHTVNGPSTITFNITSTSSYVWKSHRTGVESTYLTSLIKYVDPDDITMPGNYTANNYGWDSDAYPDHDYVIGRGYYEISVLGKSATLIVDCYGTDFQGDIIVLYDYSLDVFKVNGDTLTEINLYDDPNGLQPTAPEYFTCTNPDKKGEHPHFTWTAPDWPGVRGGGKDLIIYYKIFRNNAEIESGITSEYWTDENVGLHPSGNTYTYQVKAYLAHSPDSDPSSSVSIKGYLFKETSQEQHENSDIKPEAGEKQRFSLSAYPNPFNSTTMIQYSIPQASQVTLNIFNLQGEVVKKLVDGYQTANHYQVIWNGENEVGAKVASGIYLYQLQTDNYSQIKRMIFIK